MSVILQVAAMAVAAILGTGVVIAGGASVTSQRLASAADAAALAAADAATGFASGDPCERARDVAEANGVAVATCEVNAHRVEVSVTDTYAGFAVVVGARAGSPDQASGVESGEGTHGWVRPSDGTMTSGFGPREQECGESYCSSHDHLGQDYATGCGAPIYAAASGTVALADREGGFGNHIRIDHGDGLVSGYAHIQEGGILVEAGERVLAGQLIALEGDSGNSFGCHLHIEILVNGVAVDPLGYIP